MRSLQAASPVIAAFLLFWAGPAMGQTPSAKAPHSPAGQVRQPAGQPVQVSPQSSRDVDFISDPIRIDSVGFVMNPPIGCTVTASQVGALTRVSLKDNRRENDPRWLITIETPHSDNPSVALFEVADKTLSDVLSANAIVNAKTGDMVGSKGRVISRIKNLTIPGVAGAGERFYVSMPQGQAQRVEGYTIFKISPGQFVALQLICGEQDFAEAQRIYETVIATVKIQDPTTLDERRREAITAGVSFLSNLTPADYEAAAKQSAQLFRLYKPAPSGAAADAEERGYRSVRFFKGTRTQINPQSKDDRPGASNPAGYLAEVSARLVDRIPSGEPVITDIQGFYFLSVDRVEEAWSIRMARHESPRKPPSIFTETGTRSGKNMTVVVDRPGKAQPTVKPTMPSEGYISQVEVFMLPRLLQSAGAELDLGFYGYQSLTENITMRRDSVTRDPAMPGVWRITTRPRESAEPTVYTFRDNGELLRAELPEGLAMEPIWPADLEKLWKGKGLPTGPINYEIGKPKAPQAR